MLTILSLKGRNFYENREVRVNAHVLGVGFALLCSRVFDHLNDQYCNCPTPLVFLINKLFGTRVSKCLLSMKNKLLLLAMGIALSAQSLIAQVPSYVPTNGLVGYWPFNGNANDVSGNNNNGTVNGATLTSDRNGNANSAYSFNGSSNFIQVANSSSLQNVNSITISAWINITQLYQSGGSGFFPIVSKSNSQGTYGNYAFGFWSPNIIAHLNNAETATAFPFSIGNWQNVVVSIGNGTTSFYLNGNLLWSGNSGVFPNNPVNNLPLIFGMDRPGLVEYANGKIDDIGIWNRVLTSQEISSMFNQVPIYSDNCNNVSGSLTYGLVGYWPFCGNANDDSGNGNNGTVNGATLTTDRFGNANSAYSFDGVNDFISVPANSFPTIQRTVSAWVKCSGVLNGGVSPFDYQTLLDYGSAGGIMLKMSDFKWLYNYGPNNQPTTNTSINQDTWYNLVFTLDSNASCKFFINGNLVGTGNISNFSPVDLSQWSSIASIGRSSNNAWHWNGTLDDLGIWNRSLTPSEITQLYNQNQCFTNTTVTDTLVINVGQLSYTNPVTYANNITIAPNPASTEVNINFNNITNLNGGTLKIINSLGQEVATTPITTSGTNSTMQLETWGGTGMYFVQIINPQGQIVDIKKIILQ